MKSHLCEEGFRMKSSSFRLEQCHMVLIVWWCHNLYVFLPRNTPATLVGGWWTTLSHLSWRHCIKLMRLQWLICLREESQDFLMWTRALRNGVENTFSSSLTFWSECCYSHVDWEETIWSHHLCAYFPSLAISVHFRIRFKSFKIVFLKALSGCVVPVWAATTHWSPSQLLLGAACSRCKTRVDKAFSKADHEL